MEEVVEEKVEENPNPIVKVIMPEGVTSVTVGEKVVEANAEGHFEMELKHALHMIESFGARIWQKIVPRRPTADTDPPADPPAAS